ncbi:MAG: four helix bundle protein [Bacteroidota bacterium]
MRDFKKLEVWKGAHEIALSVYLLSSNFPKEEIYGLTSQIRRCAVSIPSNISEGCGRSTENELRRFCDIAMGSASELEYQLLLAFDLNFIQTDTYEKINNELIVLKKRLNAFIQKLKSK